MDETIQGIVQEITEKEGAKGTFWKFQVEHGDKSVTINTDKKPEFKSGDRGSFDVRISPWTTPDGEERKSRWLVKYHVPHQTGTDTEPTQLDRIEKKLDEVKEYILR
jgi:hypothetical protein